MHKAIQLRLTLRIEGDDEPANDFAKLSTQLVRELLAGPQVQKRNVKVTVKDLQEVSADDDADYKPGSLGKPTSKP